MPNYTSQDLTVLPCELHDKRFFYPLEFNQTGEPIFPDQIKAIKSVLDEPSKERIKDLYVFVHGWDKTASFAERDYQDFICRFYAHGLSQKSNFLLVGLFWPSTVLANYHDPWFVKWVTYFAIRQRADSVAENGFTHFMREFVAPFPDLDNLYFIGHSFGGRILINGLLSYAAKDRPINVLTRLGSLQIVLLNAAVSAEVNSRPNELIESLLVRKETELHKPIDVRIFNVYSDEDYANRILYPVGSWFDRAAGANPFPDYPISDVDTDGSLWPHSNLAVSNIWNINASSLIHEHSDIYKGRVARLLGEMLALPLSNPMEAQKRFRKAIRLGLGGDTAAGGRAYSEALNKDPSQAPNFADSVVHMVQTFLGRGGLREATNISQTAVFGDPAKAQLHSASAKASGASGDWHGAAEAYEKAAQLEPSRAEWRVGLGWSYAQLHDGARTEDSYRKAAALRPTDPEIRILLGLLLLDQNKWDEAELVAEEAVQLAGQQSEFEAHNLLGRVHLAKQNWAKATHELEWFIANYPYASEYHDDLSDVLRKQGKLLEAEEHLRRAEQIRQEQARKQGINHAEDSQEKRTIRSGSSMRIVLNKVHLKRNGEALCASNSWIGNLGCVDRGEIAAVVTLTVVGEGKKLAGGKPQCGDTRGRNGDKVKCTLILFEEEVTNGSDLSINDLLVYATPSYAGESVHVEVAVFDLDNMNPILKDSLASAAAEGSFLTPAFTPRLSMADQVGEILLATNKNSLIERSVFTINGWSGRNIGTPLRVPHSRQCGSMIISVDDLDEPPRSNGVSESTLERARSLKLRRMSDRDGLNVLQKRVWHHFNDKGASATESDALYTIC